MMTMVSPLPSPAQQRRHVRAAYLRWVEREDAGRNARRFRISTRTLWLWLKAVPSYRGPEADALLASLPGAGGLLRDE
jgi:hypothetical protein